MSDILFQYHKIDPTTWVYVSSLLTIGLFFKFSRLWSIRNLDLILLILFAPGLVLIDWGVKHGAIVHEQAGYIWLLAMTLIWLIRMLLDSLMVRRPLLEPNLSPGGTVFIGVALLVFLMANVVNSNVTREDLAAAAGKPLPPVAAPPESTAPDAAPPAPPAPLVQFGHGPGYPLLYLLPRIPTHVFIPRDLNLQPGKGTDVAAVAAARTMDLVKRERHIAEHYVLRRLMMEPGFHALSDLFKQLGLPSDNGSVQRFIMEHAPLPDAMRLRDTPAPAQRARSARRFLRPIC